MTGSTANGNGVATARSGAHTLCLLATPLNVVILTALADGPVQQSDLRRIAGSPAQSTLRAQLRKLAAARAIERRRRNRFPGVLEHGLTEAGRELLGVLVATERWLARAPGGPIALDEPAAKAAIKALAGGWTTTILRALAAKPMTLTELDDLLPINYPSLERRLSAMRDAGQVEARPSEGRGTPYGVTEWARRGVAPLAAAARWERRRLAGATAPIGRVDVEAAFLLTMPLLRLGTEVSGSSRMAVELPNGRNGQAPALAGVLVEAGAGRIASCTTRLQGCTDGWASGPPGAWLGAVVASDADELELGGDCSLVRALLDGIHRALFLPAAAQPRSASAQPPPDLGP